MRLFDVYDKAKPKIEALGIKIEPQWGDGRYGCMVRAIMKDAAEHNEAGAIKVLELLYRNHFMRYEDDYRGHGTNGAIAVQLALPVEVIKLKISHFQYQITLANKNIAALEDELRKIEDGN